MKRNETKRRPNDFMLELDDAEKAMLVELAQRDGVSMAATVRRLIREAHWKAEASDG